jgi:predicted aminopeptidase
MRVYLPSTLPALAGTLRAGQLGDGPAFAVTPLLREAYASGDQEELEYVALTAAARASLRMLAADPDAAPRRVVLAAEVDDSQVSWAALADDADPAQVRLTGPLPIAALAAAHVDDEQASGDIRAAVEALAAADAGDDDALFAVDQAEGHELGWYATQELPYLVEL